MQYKYTKYTNNNKMTTKINSKSHCTQTVVKGLGCTNILCPKDEALPLDSPNSSKPKKYHKFLNITLNKNQCTPRESPFSGETRPPSRNAIRTASQLHLQTPSKIKQFGVEQHQEHEKQSFEADKQDFFQKIRNFSPSASGNLQESQKPSGSHLSRLLSSLNEQLLSGMFVSSHIKSKIVESGTLDSISEVRSQLEKSLISHSMRNGSNFREGFE